MVDRGSNRRVSKSVVEDRGSNRRVSKNHIGGVKVSRIALSVVDCGVKQKSIKESHRWCKG